MYSLGVFFLILATLETEEGCHLLKEDSKKAEEWQNEIYN
jgi:hypothetical protein